MATIQANVDRLGRKNLLQAVKLYDPSKEVNFHALMAGNKVTTKQSFEEIAAYGGLDLPVETAEYGSAPITEYEQIYTAQFPNTKMMLEFRISNEAFDDEQGYGILKAYGTDMAGVFHQKMEMDAADRFMNNAADGTNYPGPDGVALGSASHPLANGATASNILSPAESLSPLSVTTALAMLKKTKAHKGYLMPIIGPVYIECSAEDELLAEQIRESVQQQGTSDNDKNVVGRKIAGVIGNPYFTNPRWWAIRIAANNKHKRFMQIRENFNLTHWGYQKSNDSWEATARARYVFGTMGWRGAVYSFAS